MPFLAVVVGVGCFAAAPSRGGGARRTQDAREVDVADVIVPDRYRVEVVAEGLTFPTGVTFDDAGGAYVVEAGYAYGEKVALPRLLRVREGGRPEVVAAGGDPPGSGVRT
ncbi:MAG: hypothetical protein ACOZNI_37780 [Myxococcota bacterium]